VGADEVTEHRPRRLPKRRDAALDFGDVKPTEVSLADRMAEGIRRNNDALRSAWARVVKRKEG
jgi:hypothetical protein